MSEVSPLVSRIDLATPPRIPLEHLRERLDPTFLSEAGWDPVAQVLAPPREHPLLGLKKCAVVPCLAGVRSPKRDLCKICNDHLAASDLPYEEFVLGTSFKKRSRGEASCVVPGCGRPADAVGSQCFGHKHHRRKWPDLTTEQWIEQEAPQPFASLGDCRVPSCIRTAATRRLLCVAHAVRWRLSGTPESEFTGWVSLADPIEVDYTVILRGLPERIQVEILLATQARTEAGSKTPLAVLRTVVRAARAHSATELSDLLEIDLERARHDTVALLRSFLLSLRRMFATVETEFHQDVWDLSVFGARGEIDYREISQPWMREAAKHWAREDLPTHRGRQSGSTAQATIIAVTLFSASLRGCRPDHGLDHRALGREDILNFLNEQAHAESSEAITRTMRVKNIRRVSKFLRDIRALGLTDPGQPLEGMRNQFAIRRNDGPEEVKSQSNRSLPDYILRAISANLATLEARSGVGTRRATELLIDTGRRPDEITRLPFDCLEEQDNGTFTLIYSVFKVEQVSRRLGIARQTAEVIRDQQRTVRERFPDTPTSLLALFPREYSNPKGTKSLSSDKFTDMHRTFIDSITDRLKGPDGTPFPPHRVFPYAYRHSYAQRHADGGTPPDILSELLGHESHQTTMGYYRVTENRARDAVLRIATHQFNAAGDRVFKDVTDLLEEDHARLRVGQIAVPYGICTEPSNVKAGGNACPNKFVCLGCDHFRSDASYLPELRAYLDRQIEDRERILASQDMADWAKEKAAPAEREIEEIRSLIRRIEDDFGSLSPADKELIEEAVNVMRQTRRTVDLGLPRIGPPPKEH